MAEMITSQSILTGQITTGNLATVNDKVAVQPLGTKVYTVDDLGRIRAYRYVQINSTVPPVEVVGPVYYKDDTNTVVTCVMSEGKTATANSIAGVLLNKDITNAYYGWIQVKGKINMTVAAATAKGDAIIGAAAQATAKVAAGTAPTNKVLGWALTDIDGGGKSDVDICVENA